MKSKENVTKLQELSLSIGDFIRYWGFRRVHGAIWTQLYLSSVPLSGADLTRRLDISKALVSPALGELERWGLIIQMPPKDEKTKLYVAADDVNKVIKHVLKIREQKMMEQIEAQVKRLDKITDVEGNGLNPERVALLQDMVSSAQIMLKMFLGSDDLLNFPKSIEVHPPE